MSLTEKTWAVVPIKELCQSKQRLSSAFAPAFRQGLAKAMLEDVLHALAQVADLSGILVVTTDPEATCIALRFNAKTTRESAGAGHSAALSSAAARLESEGCTALLALPADVPLITPQEIKELLATTSAAPSMTIVPSLAEDGTNAILCSPPTIMPFAFGPDSFRRHLEAARGLGLEPCIVRSPGIGLDIDLHSDLQRFMGTPSNTHTRKFCLTHDPMAAATAVEGVR